MTSTSDIYIVSGLPRSGTSLMMQMLHRGGLEVMTDQIRMADVDNPKGYFEFEAVKSIEEDASWLPQSRGKVFKMISLLLYQLPATEHFRVLFMERDLEEILQSQEAMLRRLQRPAIPRDQMREAFTIHLEQFNNWLKGRPEMSVLRVGYKDLIEAPARQAERINEFLGTSLDIEAMANAIDPDLYRNRNSEGR
ncbi:sulfotransferase domain-containing protein [Schlesneria paludicola]|uniref:sulfotransferase domain-containing protein n=1 Tax=Schlesneria paludicola TaxID=360056 RepID=UPI00029A85CC|nr:sulfotransferase domain-containing protein [Schlesneria paludicola]